MSLKDQVLASDRLPSLPSVATRILQLSDDPETGLLDFADLLRQDPALTAKLLKTANSAYYSFRSELSSIERAVPLLGRTTVVSLSLSFVLLDLARGSESESDHFSEYWRLSIVQAVVAENLCTVLGYKPDGAFFMSALMSGIGRLACLKAIPTEFGAVLEADDRDFTLLEDIELRELGFSHTSIGVELLSRWQLVDSVISAVEHQSASVERLAELETDPNFPLILTTALSVALGEFFSGRAHGAGWSRAEDLLDRFRPELKANFDDVIVDIRKRVDDASGAFQFDSDGIGDATELMAQANEQLAMLAIRESSAAMKAAEEKAALNQQKRKLEEERDTLASQAVRDPLTGQYNRRHLQEALEKEVARARRYTRGVGAIFLDIDHFKALNDTWGHAFGDTVLIEVAKTIASTVRETDIVCRFGGEEFVVALVEPTEDGLVKLCERIRQNVAALKFGAEGNPVRVTVSIGATMTVPSTDEAGMADRLIETADAAMYRSKQTGRNKVTVTNLISDRQRRLFHRVTQCRFSRWLVENEHADRITVFRSLQSLAPQSKTFEQIAQELRYLTDLELVALNEAATSTGDWIGAIALDRKIMTEQEVTTVLTILHEDPQAFARLLIEHDVFGKEAIQGLLATYLETLFPTAVGDAI